MILSLQVLAFSFLCVWGHIDMLEYKTFLGSGDSFGKERFGVGRKEVSLPDTCSTLLIST